MTDTARPWGFMLGDRFIEVPKTPMLMAGLGPPPFDVRLPTGAIRHIVEKPEEQSDGV